MNHRTLRAALLLSLTAVFSCGKEPTAPKGAHDGVTALQSAASVVLPPVRISEFHYDNTGGDVGEAIEVSFPTGTSLAGWTLIRYNGSSAGAAVTYSSPTAPTSIAGLTPTACGGTSTRSVVVLNYPPDGLQNGTADGFALVNGTTVVELLSYEGVFTAATGATGGPAAGMTSTDIGKSENGTEPAGRSLQRDGSGNWSNPIAATFGVCNDDETPPPAVVAVSPSTLTVNVGDQPQFSATETNGGSPVSTSFTWSSTNEAVATIDATGKATALAPGTTTIKAKATDNTEGTATLTVVALTNYSGQVVISQFYGGGGNGGATYTNDFIEIFNRTESPVSINGWSVQYASASGSFTQTTPISGTLQPGKYYLVQLATGGAVGAPLPAFDASGSINMSGTSGKILLAQTTTAIGTACPSGVTIVDIVAYGSVTGCGPTAPSPSNTTSDQRKNAGCRYTGNPSNDFVSAAPAPRNSTTSAHSCVPGPLDHVLVSGAPSVFVGATIQLNAEGLDVNDNTVIGGTTVWSTSDAAVATVSATGVVTGVSSTNSPATITAAMTAGGVTKSATFEVAVTNPGGINWLEIAFVRTSSMPPGFETEMAMRARESSGGPIIPATFTYEAIDAANIAAVPIPGNNTSALLTALSAPADGSKPRVKVTATPVGGGASYSFTFRPITVEVPVAAPSSIYGFNDAFGRPSAAGTSANDFLIQRDQFVLSYNQSRGTPNWVAYELDARHMSGADRCNCFTADPLLPTAARIYLYDYTGSGYDRGHMARSFDRTAGNVDNATTFYMTNMVPQFSELNSGPWGQFENMLGDSARFGGRAVHIVTGPLYTTPLRFVNDTGKVAIPDFTWKVALIGPRDGSGTPFSQVSSWSEISGLTVLAVKMPNISTPSSNPLTYLTTVEALEQDTGYDLFNLLVQGMQNAIQYKDRAPTAAFSVGGTQNEGSTVTFDASASSDPDAGRTDLGGRTEGLTYTWTFSDGATATGAVVTRTFANDGSYTATLTVTDVFGWPASATQTVAIANVAPSVGAVAGATILPGETYAAAGSFTDPGSDSWTATVNYGDGSGTAALALSGMNFSLSHTYAAAGTFTVTVTVNDGTVTTTRTLTVVVQSATAALGDASTLIDSFGLNNGNANSLKAKINAATQSLENGNTTPALNQLNALLNQINAFEASGTLTPAQAATLRELVTRIIESISP